MASDLRLKEELPALTDEIVETYTTIGKINHLGHCPLPKYEDVVSATEDLKDILYPGFRRREGLHIGNVTYHVGDLIDGLQPSGATRGQPEDESMEENALDVELRALAVEDELGYEVSEALDRISEETFGLCGTCGEWISRARLQLLPYARLCSVCARKAE